MNRKRGLWVALWALLVIVIGWLAFSDGPAGRGYGPWHGWARMGGWHMGNGHYGSWPQAWHGQEPGMAGGYGGPMAGMDCFVLAWQLPDLTPLQDQKIAQARQEQGQRNLELTERLGAEQLRLNRLYSAEKRDWDAIRASAQTMFDLQQQQMDAAIDTQQKIDGLLTDGQRRQIARSGCGQARWGAR